MKKNQIQKVKNKKFLAARSYPHDKKKGVFGA
jgi:hypothetical protein